MTDTTRIMDLPENITMHKAPSMQGPPGGGGGGQNPGFGNSYTPMDVHPNPYGHPPPSVPTIPKPSEQFGQQGFQGNQGPTQNFTPQMQPSTHQALPSRDIPMDQSNYTHDEQVQANYIPPVPDSVKKTTEYVKQYEEATEKRVRFHDEEKAKQSRFDTLVEEGQIPILVAVLFFIFHMPIVDQQILKHLSFLALHDLDGNFNVYGLLFKSMLFGSLFYTMTQIIHGLSEI